MDGRVKPFIEWHQATGRRVADVTAVLMHYPFVSTFREKVEDAVRTGRYGGTTTDEYVGLQQGARAQSSAQPQTAHRPAASLGSSR